MAETRQTAITKLTQKDINAAIARHEMLVSGRMGGARAVFAFCDLSGLDLSGRNLSDADFTGAILEETDFFPGAAGSDQPVRRRPAPGQSQWRLHAPRRSQGRVPARGQSDQHRSL